MSATPGTGGRRPPARPGEKPSGPVTGIGGPKNDARTDGTRVRRIDLLTSVRRHRAWLVAGLLLGLLIGGVLSLTAVRTYTSTTQLFVGTAGTTATSDAYEGNLFSQQRVASYAQILTSRELAQEVIDAQQLPLTAREVAAKV